MTETTTGGPGNPFTSLSTGLEEFASRLDGSPGDKVAALDGEEGALPDAVRALLTALADGLGEIKGLMDDVSGVVRQIDAAVAAAEVMLAIVSGTTELGFGDMAETLGFSREPIDKVNSAIRLGVDKVELALRITDLLPSAEEVDTIHTLIKRLLVLHDGTPEDEETYRSLADLLSTLGVTLE